MRADPPDSEDLVVWMLRAVLDAMPGLPPNTIILIEQATRLHWGGRRSYIRHAARRYSPRGPRSATRTCPASLTLAAVPK